MLVGYMRVSSDTIGRPRTSNVPPCSPLALMCGICLTIRPAGRGMIAPDFSRRSTTFGPAMAWASGNWTDPVARCRISCTLLQPYRRRGLRFAP